MLTASPHCPAHLVLAGSPLLLSASTWEVQLAAAALGLAALRRLAAMLRAGTRLSQSDTRCT